MKTLFQPAFHLAAVVVSMWVNVLLVSSLDAALSSHQAQSVRHVQLPPVTVVAKRAPLAATQLVAAGTINTL